MENYKVTGEMFVDAVSAYYNNDYEAMLKVMHPNATFLSVGRNQLIEGRDNLRDMVLRDKDAVTQRKVSYEIVNMNNRMYKVKPNSCYNIAQMDVRAIFPDGTVSQVNQRIVVNWQHYNKLLYAPGDYREGWFAVQIHASVASNAVGSVEREGEAGNLLHGALNSTVNTERFDGDRYEIRDVNKKLNYIGINRIIRFQADGAYSMVHLDDKSVIRAHKSLDAFENDLGEKGFIRIHRKYLVNSIYCNKIFGRNLEMSDGDVYPVSRDRIRNVRQLLQSLPLRTSK